MARKNNSPDLARHARDCSICSHRRRDAIETDFVDWISPVTISRRYHVARRAVYRHAAALDLLSKRDRNIRASLARIIEQSSNVKVTGHILVAAITAYTKINSAGRWVDRSEQTNMNMLFERMSEAELDSYARSGELPTWFEQTLAGTREPSAANAED
jgi:hypothetical protein